MSSSHCKWRQKRSQSAEMSLRPHKRKEIIDAAIKNYGRLDILVNNSGVYEFSPIGVVTEDWSTRSST